MPLQLIVLGLALDAGQLHTVVIAEFRRLVPIGLYTRGVTQWAKKKKTTEAECVRVC